LISWVFLWLSACHNAGRSLLCLRWLIPLLLIRFWWLPLSLQLLSGSVSLPTCRIANSESPPMA
jgi:hypothetical protein